MQRAGTSAKHNYYSYRATPEGVSVWGVNFHQNDITGVYGTGHQYMKKSKCSRDII